MADPGTTPASRISIFSEEAADRLTVDLKTKKLYWDDKEVVARKTIDVTGISRVWAWIVAIVALCAGVGGALNGLVNLNKETCWIKIGACKVALRPTLAPPTSAAPTSATPPPPTPPDPQQTIVLSDIYFDTNSATLKLDSGAALENVIQSLKANPSLHVEMQGHTDNSGSTDHNLKLSRERTASVMQWLTSHGIAAERLTSEGYGASKPIADNGTIEGRAKNRRVEFRKM